MEVKSMDNWNNVKLVPEFSEQGVDCYRLEGGNYENEYYVVSEYTGSSWIRSVSLSDSVHFSDALLFQRTEESNNRKYSFNSSWRIKLSARGELLQRTYPCS